MSFAAAVDAWIEGLARVPAADVAELLAAEGAAGARDPYRQVAALLHLTDALR